MASTLLPSAGDQENMLAQPGSIKKAFNKHPLNVSNRKLKIATPQSQLLFPGKLQQPSSSGRTFGDISNRLNGRGGGALPTPSAGKPLKLQKPMQKQRLVQQNKVHLVPAAEQSADNAREFFPVITETEDYSDLLPSHLVLDDATVLRLVQGWHSLQRPDGGDHQDAQPPSSPLPQHHVLHELPKHDWQYASCGAELSRLHPVDEVFDLPAFPADW